MVSIMNYIPFGKLLSAIIGCGLLSTVCVGSPSAQSVSIQTFATSSPYVTVVTDVNGSSSTQVINAPYGLQSSVVSESNGSTTIAEATTTPLTSAYLTQMQQQMNQVFADQQKLFQSMLNGF